MYLSLLSSSSSSSSCDSSSKSSSSSSSSSSCSSRRHRKKSGHYWRGIERASRKESRKLHKLFPKEMEEAMKQRKDAKKRRKEKPDPWKPRRKDKENRRASFKTTGEEDWFQYWQQQLGWCGKWGENGGVSFFRFIFLLALFTRWFPWTVIQELSCHSLLWQIITIGINSSFTFTVTFYNIIMSHGYITITHIIWPVLRKIVAGPLFEKTYYVWWLINCQL